MGREIRMVPKDWQHPRYTDEDAQRQQLIGKYKPLHEGYAGAAKTFLDILAKYGLQAAIDYYGQAPDKDDYMPDWADSEKTHLQMYETCSEGTPISPVMATPEELAHWLADNNASAFGGMTATYEQWLRVCEGGYAPSAIMTNGKFESGVAGLSD